MRFSTVLWLLSKFHKFSPFYICWEWYALIFLSGSVSLITGVFPQLLKKIRFFEDLKKKLDIKRQFFSIFLKIHLFFPPKNHWFCTAQQIKTLKILPLLANIHNFRGLMNFKGGGGGNAFWRKFTILIFRKFNEQKYYRVHSCLRIVCNWTRTRTQTFHHIPPSLCGFSNTAARRTFPCIYHIVGLVKRASWRSAAWVAWRLRRIWFGLTLLYYIYRMGGDRRMLKEGLV